MSTVSLTNKILQLVSSSHRNWDFGTLIFTNNHFGPICSIHTIYRYQKYSFNDIITKINKRSICLWRTHELFLCRDNWQVRRISQISIPKTMNVFSTDGLNTILFLLHTIHSMLIRWIYCSFTHSTILYKKKMPARWSPFRDHIAEDHTETMIICNNIDMNV